MTSRPWLLMLFLALPLRADGVEVALGVCVAPTGRGAAPGSFSDNTTALQVRLGWDQSPSQVRMDQWQALAQGGSSHDLQYSVAGAGWQRSWWTKDHQLQGALGADLRVEQYQGHSSLASGPTALGSQRAWLVRPWLRAQAGFRGILFPFLSEPAGGLLAALTHGGVYTHPFTRLEVAIPLWHQGGEGDVGLLRQMAPRWEASVHLGMRFGRVRQ